MTKGFAICLMAVCTVGSVLGFTVWLTIKLVGDYVLAQ
jgi:hypothetical protein